MAGDTDSYADSYEFQVPIFVVTHHPPETMPRQNENLTFTFVTDGIESAVAQAKAAAGDRVVTVVGGARLIQEMLLAGLVDELWVDIMPVFLGTGIRHFDDRALERVKIETLDVQEVGQRIATRFRVLKDI